MPSASQFSQVGDKADLSKFFREIRRYPMLKPEEEFDLAKRWQKHQDDDAAHQLVNSHLRLVAKIARSYRGYGLPLNELISEGNVGMMKAVKKFDPDRGFRFSTYAMWWIRAAIQEYILHSWSLVKIGTTAAQKKLFFNLRSLKGKLQAIDEGELRPENVRKIAESLNVPERDVISMNMRMAFPDRSLNTPLKTDGEGEWLEWLADDGESQESSLAAMEELNNRRDLLQKGIGSLDERERNILTERRLSEKPRTLEELSQRYGISRERVRQVEARAFEKLQKSVRNHAMEQRLENWTQPQHPVKRTASTT